MHKIFVLHISPYMYIHRVRAGKKEATVF